MWPHMPLAAPGSVCDKPNQIQGCAVESCHTDVDESFGKSHQLYVHECKNEAYKEKNNVTTV